MDLKLALDTYKAHNAAEKLIIGYADAGKVYGFVADFDVLYRADVCKIDGKKVRFQPTATARMDLTWLGGQFIMNEVDFNAQYAEWQAQGNKGNKGHFFEWYITINAGQEYHKDNKKWWEYPDIIINGIKYQVKFLGATVLEESHIEKCKV